MVEGRRRAAPARETLIGVDSSGAEYWLVPFSGKKVGCRKFEIRKSKKQVPAALQGLITDAGTAERLFNKWKLASKAKKVAPKASTAAE